MLGSNNSTLAHVNGTISPLTIPQRVGRCYIPGGPPVEWQRSFRFYTSAVGLPIAIVFCIMCLAANATILVSILRRKLAKPRLLIVCSLAISDLFLAVIMSYSIWAMIQKLIADGGCTPRNAFLSKLYHVGYHICFVSSIGSLMLMSIDCYLCVSRPLTYRSVASTSRVLQAVVLVWLLVAIYTTVYQESSSDVRNILISVLSTMFAIPTVIFLILTYVSYRAHNNSIADHFTASGVQTRNSVNERKIAISVAYLLSTLVIGYFPRIVAPIISAAEGFKVNHLMALFNTISLLGCATARPIVTYRKNADVRRGVHVLFRREESSQVFNNQPSVISLPQTDSSKTS